MVSRAERALVAQGDTVPVGVHGPPTENDSGTYSTYRCGGSTQICSMNVAAPYFVMVHKSQSFELIHREVIM